MMIANDQHVRYSASSSHRDSEGQDATVPGAPNMPSADRPECRSRPEHEDSTTGATPPAPPTQRPPASVLRLLRPLLDACVFGGVTVTPILAIVGWVGLILPVHETLHQLATPLLCVAMIWLGFAIAAAHTVTVKQDAHRAAK